MEKRGLAVAAALFGLVAVAAGALGVHGFEEAGDPRGARLMTTGSQYQMWHALAALLAIRLGSQPLAPLLFLGGAVLFSGSLYLLALGAPTLLGIVTPFGGLAFMAGWAVLAYDLWRRPAA